ncbi:DUF3558 domain-containing protein [Amycolatopsis sp.]|uniref:DUF3558 domain-containing protein n=1 Tax=Amycolatopsis sp. TaxID=37632 RepID=UPI002C562246|nr:DUF3558 domain-containing protein [Amycolatopsis sp.]HVV12855.1 DUF3558 domain-containing protein [Amycolatopsis sp.]
MKSNRRLTAAACMLALLAASASACSNTTQGTPSAATSSDENPSSAVPTVAHPLDPSSYVGKPCDLVPQQLVSQLGYSDPTPSDANSALGPGCGWIDVRTSQGKNLNVSVQILKGKRNGGIASVYKTKDAGGYDFVDPTEVSGYPAVFADTQDRRPEGDCNLFVGIADDLTFGVAADGYQNEQDSCGAATQVAASVITTLQGGS